MTTIKPITKDLVSQKVTDALISYIHRSGLKVGDKLPGERLLAQELEVGRNSVRKALLQLEEEGIVERFAGRGAFIRKEVDADSIQLKLAKVDYQDLLEIKICIEQLAIRRAAERATDQQIARLITIAEELVELADQGIFSVEHDRKFHLQLLECGGSTTLVQMVLSLIDSLNNFTNVLGGDAQEIWLKTIPYHMDIATALALREADHALAAHQYIYRLDIEALNKMAEQNQTI